MTLYNCVFLAAKETGFKTTCSCDKAYDMNTFGVKLNRYIFSPYKDCIIIIIIIMLVKNYKITT